MLFAIMCYDKPDMVPTRQHTRPQHLAYLHSLGARLKMAGPFLDDQQSAIGSLIVVSAKTAEEARDIIMNDPYAKQGIFADIRVQPFNWTINNPESI